jgi:hypothetical protein
VSRPVEDISKNCYTFANRHRHLVNHTMGRDDDNGNNNVNGNDNGDDNNNGNSKRTAMMARTMMAAMTFLMLESTH